MEERKILIRSSSQLEDIPDLYHRIQLLLPLKEAARTCVLSKSWLHAWSTIPTLRFAAFESLASEEQRRKHFKMVDTTLLRYLRDNIPIEMIHLSIDIKDHESASLAEKWIRSVAAKSCLRLLYLSTLVDIDSFTLPHEMLSGKNLKRIMVSGYRRMSSSIRPLWISSNTVIKCESLAELELMNVHICDEVLHNLLSTCSLLEKIELIDCTGWKTITVKNLRFFYNLTIASDVGNGVLKIDEVPNLRFFMYSCSDRFPMSSLPFNTDSLGSVTELILDGLIMDGTFSDLLKSKLPFLESLSLGMEACSFENFDITCDSLKRLSLRSGMRMLTDIQVYAPKLRFFHYHGHTMPSLLFPVMAPEQIEVVMELRYPEKDHSIFRRMRETLMLSSVFDIKIYMTKEFDGVVSSNCDTDVMVGNVQRLALELHSHRIVWAESPFFDSLFSICRPKQVVVERPEIFEDNSRFLKLVVSDVLEKKKRKGYWVDYVRDVEIKNPVDGKWEMLTDSWGSYLDELTHVEWQSAEFKLHWCSS